MLPSIWPSEFMDDEINDPHVYIHCCGGYLRGCCWLYFFGRVIRGMMCVVGVLFLGVFFHACENSMRYCGVVDLMGNSFIYVFVVCCSTSDVRGVFVNGG